MARTANPENRDRIVRTTRDLIRRNGIQGTTMLEVVKASGGSRGSLYHYFPGGRAEMVEDAVRSAIDEYTAGIEYLATLPAAQAIPLMVEFWRAEAEASDYAAGCPIAAAALGGASDPVPSRLAGEAFAGWIDAFARMLVNEGIPADRARALGTLAIAAVEGAVILGLAQKSSTPMELVADQLVALVDAAQ
ncbi:putative TetR-family transcriptional regulator [Nocardioides phosphati]|uniref:TetR-family transcriptional regulator n=1 Tax=Nocardioides phosphati TaxID=1867775 RepID=A0ABQ2N6T0_9ACTN|nr:TetR/AcrR family transcriptional regulator [Nocardioides phosphati]GGO84535.1 putative TetR-family transcriptional regulator [Nocardioides phosphati]